MMWRKGLFDTLCFTDLDGVIFQSRFANPAGLHPMEEKGDQVIGWSTAEQAEWWDEIRHQAFCIGVTHRHLHDVASITGWNPLHQHQLMLANHGFTMLYRDIRTPYGWKIIPGWGQSFEDDLRPLVKTLHTDAGAVVRGARLHHPDYSAKPIISRLVGLMDGFSVPVLLTLDASELLRACFSANEPGPIRELRNHLETFARGSGRYLLHECEGCFSLIPMTLGRPQVITRLMGLIRSGDDLGDHRLSKILRDIGRPSECLGVDSPSIQSVRADCY